MNERLDLLERGTELLCRFCDANNLSTPEIITQHPRWPFDACAYYRQDQVFINTSKCALIGRTAQAWSYPGYKVDRTPYGVLQHELGHHVDLHMGVTRGAYFSEFSTRMREASGEAKLTNYCPNDAEWFAEMFRLFVTNPDLLRLARPRTHSLMLGYWRPVESRKWEEVLADAPARTINKAAKFDW